MQLTDLMANSPESSNTDPNWVVTELALLKTSHEIEKADVIMINQLLWVVATSSTTKSVKLICDVTDVFALLIHYVCIQRT